MSALLIGVTAQCAMAESFSIGGYHSTIDWGVTVAVE